MINLKPRVESDLLKIYRYLNRRMNLSENEKNYFWILEKGFEGEVMFDSRLGTLSNDFITLNDLLFEVNNSTFQIDTLMIAQNSLFLFEVKNLEGDYYIKNGDWYSISETRIKNPLLQLERCATLLHNLLQQLRYNTTLDPSLIFINPEFSLYHAPLNPQITFPTQIPRLLSKLANFPSVLNENHFKLANQLLSLHKTKSKYTQVPEYDYDHLKKGLNCFICHTFDLIIINNHVTCLKCGYKEMVTSAVLRNIEEYSFLFPERKITRATIQDWCAIVSDRTILKILSKYYQNNAHGKASFYSVPSIESKIIIKE